MVTWVARRVRIPLRLRGVRALLPPMCLIFVATAVAQAPVPVLRGKPDLLLLRDAEVSIVERLEDGGVLVAGDPVWVNGVRTDRAVVRLQSDGSPHPQWQPVTIGSRSLRWANGLAAHGCGEWIYVSGFLQAEGGGTTSLARLHRSTGMRDSSWAPVISGYVGKILCDGEGALILAGTNMNFGDIYRVGVARILVDSGTLDPSWQAQASDWVREMLLAADGSLYIAGNFYSVFTPTQSVSRNGVARILPGGTIDEAWDPGAAFVPSTPMSVMALASDDAGGLYLGGRFESHTPHRDSLVRVAMSGSGAIDPLWGPPAGWLGTGTGGGVLTLHREDQWLYVGGHFESVDGVPRSSLARVSTSGAGLFDPDWQVAMTGLDGGTPAVLAMEPGAAGSLWLAGNLRSQDPSPSAGLARVTLTDGARMGTHRAASPAQVDRISAHPAGGVVIGGAGVHVEGDDRHGLLRIDAAGELDPEFDPAIRGEITALLVDNQGRVHVGGNLESESWAGVRHLVRLLPSTGAIDPEWNPQPDAAALALAFDPAGRLYVGGTFAQIAGQARAGLARFHADGSVDADWIPDTYNPHSISVAPSENWIYAGTPGGVVRYQVAAPGWRDTTWSNPWITPFGSTLLVRSDGQVVFTHTRISFMLTRYGIIALSPESGPVAQIRWSHEGAQALSALGGDHGSTMYGVLGTSAMAAYQLFRLDDAGTIDTGWMPTLGLSVSSIVRTADDTLWLGGQIGSVDGVPRYGLAAFDLRGDPLFGDGFDWNGTERGQVHFQGW